MTRPILFETGPAGPGRTVETRAFRLWPKVMRREIPAIRILPMSETIEGFGDRSIEDVQARCFLRDLPVAKGRYRYRAAGLNAEPGTVVLFQFRARIVAMAMFLRDEKFEKGIAGHAGQIHFDAKSFRTFDPLDVQAMRKVWPRFRAFGHVKQFLNPTLYPQFKRRLKNVASPVRASDFKEV